MVVVRVTSSLRKERRAVLREIYDSLCTHDLGLLARTKSMHVHRAVVRPYRQEIGYSVRLRVKCCSNRKIQHPNIYFPPRYLRGSKFLARFRAGCCCRFDHIPPPPPPKNYRRNYRPNLSRIIFYEESILFWGKGLSVVNRKRRSPT